MDSDRHSKNSKLYKQIYRERNLIRAWRKVKSNGQKSTLKETQDQIRTFDSESEREIRKIQSLLRSRNYSF